MQPSALNRWRTSFFLRAVSTTLFGILVFLSPSAASDTAPRSIATALHGLVRKLKNRLVVAIGKRIFKIVW